MTIANPEDVLKFWTDAGPQKWWVKDPEFDAQITKLFGDTYEAAAAGELGNWTGTANGTLALIIVLDQFPRNMFRNDAKTFEQDAACLEIVKSAIKEKQNKALVSDIKQFFYMPLMHSEKLEDQQACVSHMQDEGFENNVKFAKEHLDIIERFGRFPHRNSVLGRETTREEQAFLDDGGFAG